MVHGAGDLAPARNLAGGAPAHEPPCVRSEKSEQGARADLRLLPRKPPPLPCRGRLRLRVLRRPGDRPRPFERAGCRPPRPRLRPLATVRRGTPGARRRRPRAHPRHGGAVARRLRSGVPLAGTLSSRSWPPRGHRRGIVPPECESRHTRRFVPPARLGSRSSRRRPRRHKRCGSFLSRCGRPMEARVLSAPFQTLQEWAAYFAGLDIPVLRRTAKELRGLREREETIAASELADVLFADPLATTRLFAHLARLRGDREGTEITSLEGCIVMLG